MDGLAFGFIFSLRAVLPFPLPQMPIVLTETHTDKGGAIEWELRWRVPAPGQIEEMEFFYDPQGNIEIQNRVVYTVDAGGRAKSALEYRNNGAKPFTREYKYDGERLVKTIRTDPNTGASMEDVYYWTGQEVTRHVQVLASKDSIVYELVWKNGSVLSMKESTKGGSELRLYEYPSPDSIRVIYEGESLEGLYTMRDGHLRTIEIGSMLDTFRYGPEAGIRRRGAAMRHAMPAGLEAIGRDALGREGRPF